MAVKKRKFFKRIKQQYKLAIALIVIAISLTSIAALYVLYQQKEFAYYINLAGRQRMLSQKVNLQAYQILHPELNSNLSPPPDIIQTLNEFKIGFQLLSQESVISALSEKRRIEVQNLYYSKDYSIEKTIERYSDEVKRFVLASAQEGLSQQQYHVLFDPQQLETLLIALEQVVDLYQKESEQSVKNVETSILILWLLTLLIILLEIIYIFRPTQQQIIRLFEKQDIAAQKLAAAVEQAERANSVKSQLLANISHEVRTPLNGVLGMLNIMKSQRRYEAEIIQKAEQSALDLFTILDFILEFADLEQNRTKIQIRPFSLTQLLSDGYAKWQKQSEEKGIDFEIILASNLTPKMESDCHAIQSIISNICSNAIKFTEYGGVKLELQIVDINQENANLKIKVQDSGIGIPPDALENIFDAFNQQSAGLSRKYSGCGIGLSVVKQLVSLMQGQIQIDSSLGKGTCVTVCLPVKLAQPPAIEPELAAAIVDKQVVLISDNQVLVHHYSWMCNYLNIGCTRCQSSELADLKNRQSNLSYLFDLAILRQYPEFQPEQSWVLLNTNKQYVDKSTNSLPAFLSFLMFVQVLAGRYDSDSKQIWPNKRVLVVEDNEINQEVIRNLLEQAELEVIIASDGAEALNVIQQQYFDLVLMDLQMPNLDGLSATREIRKLALNYHPPIVALTAHALSQDEQACYDAGMDDFLTKPINADNLFNVLRRFLAN